MKYLAGTIQYKAIFGEKQENIHNLLLLTIEAAQTAGLIVLPELCTTGFNWKKKEDIFNLAETVPGYTTNLFSMIAKKYNCFIVLGLAEKDKYTNKLYNAQVIIDNQGHILKKYRKINRYANDFIWAQAGDLGYVVADTAIGRIGMGICFDINSEDLRKYLAYFNTQIFAFSTNWVGEESPFNLWHSLIYGNNFYFIAANNWGQEADINYSGGSCIISPNSELLAYIDEDKNSIIYGEILI